MKVPRQSTPFAKCHSWVVATAATLMSVSTMSIAMPVASWSTTETRSYATTIDFESAGVLANHTSVSNQFAPQLTVTGSASANSCGPGYLPAFAMSGNYLDTYSSGCLTNVSAETFSLKLAGDAANAALDFYTFNPDLANTLELLNDSVVVATFNLGTLAYSGMVYNQSDFTDANNRTFVYRGSQFAGILNIDGGGTLFDELRFAEKGVRGASFQLDNLRYNDASMTVPEPTSFALIVAALAAGAVARRGRRKSA